MGRDQGGGSGSLPSLATRLLGADFRKGKRWSWGSYFLWSRQSGHRGRYENQKGGWPAPRRGEVSSEQAWPGGPWLGSLCYLSWVWARGFGMKGLTKLPWGDLGPPFGHLPSSALPQNEVHKVWRIAPCPCYLQTLPILHLFTQFLYPEACCPLPSPQPLAGCSMESPFSPKTTAQKPMQPAQLLVLLKKAACLSAFFCPLLRRGLEWRPRSEGASSTAPGAHLPPLSITGHELRL